MKSPAAPHSSTTATKPEKEATSPAQQAPWVLREIADTTWRMTVPVVIFASIGIFLDLRLETTPWLTFLGVIIGFYFACVLIKKQIERS